MTNRDTPARRWYQFRLRTLLIAMALCTIPFAFVGSEIRDALRDREVAAWVNENGGSVRYDNGWLAPWIGGRVTCVELIDERVDDLTPITSLKNLQDLWLIDAQVDDEQVRMLQEALPECDIIR